MGHGVVQPVEELVLIGITGGIAAGKSTVSEMLRELGGAVIDADAIAREVVSPGSVTLEQIRRTFGAEILDGEGRLDRARLGAIVFDDPAARARLEAITHPAIAAAAARRVDELRARGHRVVFYEAALLVETGRHAAMDGLLVVTAADEQRLRRLMARSEVSRDEAYKRLAAQLPQRDKVALADYVIDNSGSLEQTRAQVEALWRRLQQEVA